MSTQSFLSVLVAAALSLSAIAHAEAGEMSSHRHVARPATAAHAAAKPWRRSYARMPVESDAPRFIPSPNLFETGRPPAQPGPAH
jgi:hypothetical protein